MNRHFGGNVGEIPSWAIVASLKYRENIRRRRKARWSSYVERFRRATKFIPRGR